MSVSPLRPHYPCADSKYGFKVGTSPEQLQKFRAKLESLFVELVEKPHLLA